ncbi:T9SS type A sorting domain-containing protein [Reichenbachiella carrageenanivorans]|uniref:T9SS type A sorting domain-containing protein n=1 Tax=Reichenbachiella carrageenanivorans TaxID=2979869 RepID=A0ABY6CW34_9BACT|nr:T9SS type A sorting domain-containing protein [Reichenbachiella carrageenanivorans]UXX77919.1 T9SS type A sorting domain-containing protein [Reichenbachiella carrageenanivorans]
MRIYSNRFFLRFLLLVGLSLSSFQICEGQPDQSEKLLGQLRHLRNASCQIVINESVVCSGVLMNTTGDFQANYILSSAHCIPDTSQIHSISLTFGGHPPLVSEDFKGARWSTSFGVDILSIDYQQDYVLYELSEIIPAHVSPYYLGWDTQVSKPAFGTTYHYSDINTQQFALKRTSIEVSSFSFPSGYKPELETISNGFWKVPNWTWGGTSVGASGAGLIDQSENYLGGLTGSTESSDGTVSDYFYRFDLAYAATEVSNGLQSFLDPTNRGEVSGAYFHDVYKSSVFNTFDTLLSTENISLSNTVEVAIDLDEPTKIRGIYMVLGEINVGLGSDLTIEVFDNDVSIYTKTISWSSFTENAENYIDFNVSISISNILKVQFSSSSDDQLEQAEVLVVDHENPAIDFSTLGHSNGAMQQTGLPMISFLSDRDFYSNDLTLDLTFFPNPSNDCVFISPASDFESIVFYDLKGRQIYPSMQTRYDEVIVDISTWPVGVYLVQIINRTGRVIRRKIIKE